MKKLNKEHIDAIRADIAISKQFGSTSVSMSIATANELLAIAEAALSPVACALRGGLCNCPTACRIDMENMAPRPVIITANTHQE